MGILWPVFVTSLSYPQWLTACLWLSLRNWNMSKQMQWQCLSVLNHDIVILQSVMSQLHLFPISVVSHLSGTFRTLSTWHSPCKQSFFSLYQVFLSNWEYSEKHCPNSSAAGPLAVCRKSAKGLWKVDKDSLQSNYPVLGPSMRTPSELTVLLTIM